MQWFSRSSSTLITHKQLAHRGSAPRHPLSLHLLHTVTSRLSLAKQTGRPALETYVFSKQNELNRSTLRHLQRSCYHIRSDASTRPHNHDTPRPNADFQGVVSPHCMAISYSSPNETNAIPRSSARNMVVHSRNQTSRLLKLDMNILVKFQLLVYDKW